MTILALFLAVVILVTGCASSGQRRVVRGSIYHGGCWQMVNHPGQRTVEIVEVCNAERSLAETQKRCSILMLSPTTAVVECER